MFKIKNFYKIVIFILFLAFFIAKPVLAEVKAPVILKAEIEVKEQEKTLIVSGVAPSATEVLLYVRDEFFAEVKTINESFIVRSKLIPAGTFSVMAVARDLATQEVSQVSNNVYPVEIVYKEEPKVETPVEEKKEETIEVKKEPVVIEPKQTTEPEIKKPEPIPEITLEIPSGEITKEAVKEEKPVVKGHEDEYSGNNTEVATEEVSDITEKSDKETTGASDEDILKKLEDILQNEPQEQGSTTGLISENEEELGKIKLNIFIFLLFLVAVIAWIVWVNRELIKEKKEEERGNSQEN